MLKINDLTKSFDRKILDDLNISIGDGTIFGLVGMNGAGKTTLLRCIAGIYASEAGEVLLNGSDTYRDPESRKDLFYVSDDPYFPYAATIKTMKEFYQTFYTLDEGEFTKYLNLFSLDVHKPLSSFSKGMKRQTMLMFAFSIRPKLLLLDEAFDGLDPLVRVHVKKGLSDLMEDRGSTIIISSHNLKELEDICDTYGILEKGHISTYGDLLESKEFINRYQLAFTHEIDESCFDQFTILHRNKEGSVYSLVIKGDREETVEKLKELHPVILDTLPVNFEELFIYEHEGGLL